MIVFWIAAAVLSAFAAALVLYRAARLARSPAGDPTVDVYRRQLGEIDDLADRGLLVESERRQARAEAARRLLNAADQAEHAAPTPPTSRSVRLWVVLGAVAAPLAALGLYMGLGSPGVPDQPFAKRLEAWRGVSDPTQLTAAQLAAVLQDVVSKRPNDPEGRLLLARAEAAAGNLPAAIQTLKTATRIAPNEVDLWAALGEALVQQAQGQETPEAVNAFKRTVALDPTAVSARYHLGRAKIMSGDLNGGLDAWRALVASLPQPDQQQALNEQIAATQKAGRLVDSQPEQQQAQTADQGQSGPGPTQDQVQAAQQAQAGAAPADQKAFIQSMVDGLAAKLKANPQDSQSWVLLIHSYGVLGEPDKQAAAYAKASKLFGSDPATLKALQDARGGGAP